MLRDRVIVVPLVIRRKICRRRKAQGLEAHEVNRSTKGSVLDQTHDVVCIKVNRYINSSVRCARRKYPVARNLIAVSIKQGQPCFPDHNHRIKSYLNIGDKISVVDGIDKLDVIVNMRVV